MAVKCLMPKRTITFSLCFQSRKKFGVFCVIESNFAGLYFFYFLKSRDPILSANVS